MTKSVKSFQASVIDLTQETAELDAKIKQQILLEDANCRYVSISLPAQSKIAEHASNRNATVHVIAGQGTLTVQGTEFALKPGVLVVMPAQARHELVADTNLKVLLTFSEQVAASV